jgi:hypothetical protein
MALKKKSADPADAGFLTTTAQAIGSTLGHIAKKAGVVGSPEIAEPPRKKAAVKRPAAKKAPAKKKARAKRST